MDLFQLSSNVGERALPFLRACSYAWAMILISPWALASPCDALTSPKAIIQCALKNHPEMQRAQAALGQADQLEAVAGQRPNPQLESKAVLGKSLGDQITGVEINLAHTFELGGKRGARLDRAGAELETAKATFLRTQEVVIVETLRSLYRVRQLKSELHALNEALHTFRKIQNQFKTRPRLGPDQAVTLAVFQVAEGDYNLRRALVETESASLTRALSLAIGQTFAPTDAVLPPRKEKDSWPKLEDIEEGHAYRGSVFRLAEAEVKLSQAELFLAQSASWPNLLVGPSYERQIEGATSVNAFGFNLSIELPLFQTNSGGRTFAAKGLVRAEKNLEVRRRELDTNHEVLIQTYKNAVRALLSAVSVRELEGKHRQMEALFVRGLLQSSLVIEAHRQIVDFNKDQNALELSALEALWQIYALEGRLSEVL